MNIFRINSTWVGCKHCRRKLVEVDKQRKKCGVVTVVVLEGHHKGARATLTWEQLEDVDLKTSLVHDLPL